MIWKVSLPRYRAKKPSPLPNEALAEALAELPSLDLIPEVML